MWRVIPVHPYPSRYSQVENAGVNETRAVIAVVNLKFLLNGAVNVERKQGRLCYLLVILR